MLVRGERASKAMQDRVLSNPKINVHWNTEVADIFGGDHMEGCPQYKTGESDLHVKGLRLVIHRIRSLFRGRWNWMMWGTL